jgi:hypothetical protein
MIKIVQSQMVMVLDCFVSLAMTGDKSDEEVDTKVFEKEKFSKSEL